MHGGSAIINTVRFKKLIGIVTDRRYKSHPPTATGTSTSTTNIGNSSGNSNSVLVAAAHPEEVKVWLSFREFVRVMMLISDSAFPKVPINTPS